ncbi:hypothetical protein TVAG_037200 [Trichomonas vaginalis G3]|uniref:Uncharacterized protein n=1 Tax=Trichomonas vaginalis (strain ATCC PRA-98 / G3) TaxID=412133 RepID=A2G0S7_TRIV3|nr:RNI-like family [Trichomonas vaginalis G3]EAX89235.1 hypothetical protein TVAG_037200 [Trichomonas vaginalis G3]KAI5507018.1 RNI-like family [Trichomonas vaginalis G3]|eukprot:XP_001302165.1 hypothetical protein [Trichomonas vaginalis G3]
MSLKIFPTDAMYKLGSGSMQSCNYDFSLLPESIYDPFFNTLPNMIYKKVENICFTCTFQRKFNTSEKIDLTKKRILSESIAIKKPQFIKYLIKILSIMLPKAKNLKSLHFVNIDIPLDQQRILFDAISKCSTLELLSFKRIEISDTNFQLLLRRITPYQYSNLSFTYCSITANSFQPICDFIQQPPPSPGKRFKLKVLELDNCNIPESNIEKIQNLLAMINGEEDGKSFLEPQREFNIESSTFDANEEESDPTIDNESLSSDFTYKPPRAYSVAHSIRSLTFKDRLKISKIDDFDSSNSDSQGILVIDNDRDDYQRRRVPTEFDFEKARLTYN